MKMKRAFISLLLMIFLGNPIGWADNPIIKLARGVENIVTSPLEYLIHYGRLHDQKRSGGVIAMAGTLYGTFWMGYRIVGGAVEAVTFLIPLPLHYAPLMKPPTPYEAVLAT